MDLRLHSCNVAPAKGHEKCAPPAGSSCNKRPAPPVRVTAREVPPVVSCCPGMWGAAKPVKSSLRQTAAWAGGRRIDPRGAVAAVPTAQVEREFGHAHTGMGAWMGQHRGGVILACNEEGYLQRTLESINPTVLQDIRPKAPTSRILATLLYVMSVTRPCFTRSPTLSPDPHDLRNSRRVEPPFRRYTSSLCSSI